MRRRRLIATLGAVSLPALAGCLGDDGAGTEGPDRLEGEWILGSRVVNEDGKPRSWRLESRSEDRESVGSAYATIPPGESWEVELRGQRYDEQREVFVESDGGAVSEPWRPAECRHLFAAVTIQEGTPTIETECREQ